MKVAAWSVREPAEKPAFLCLFLYPCFWDPTRNTVRTTARPWVAEVTRNGRREVAKAPGDEYLAQKIVAIP